MFLGYTNSAMLITPIFTGTPHDSAQWSECVIALTTLAAAIFAIDGSLAIEAV